jgi:hypothetical protein
MQDRPESVQEDVGGQGRRGNSLRTRAKIHTTCTPSDCLMSVNTLLTEVLAWR